MAALRIFVVRLSSMGDVIHALPAVASLKKSFPEAKITWLVRPKWAPLLEGNPDVDDVATVERSIAASLACARDLGRRKYDLGIDLQGLIQSAMLAAAVGPKKLIGFARGSAREGLAAIFYSSGITTQKLHAVDRYLDLVAGAGANEIVREFALPEGFPENDGPESALPEGKFILASPFAGWGSKQWPLEYWSELANSIDLPLVVNGPPSNARELSEILGARVHLSGIPGLIFAARRAHAVIGVDSGPMHLAAALKKPGVAIFGPTDPARHGPYGGSLRVLRAPDAATSYHRDAQPAASMRAITPAMVAGALAEALKDRDARVAEADTKPSPASSSSPASGRAPL